MKRLAVTVLASAGAVALMTTGVSAAIICNDEGDCWQSKETYTYPPEARVHVYGDDYVVDTKNGFLTPMAAIGYPLSHGLVASMP